MGTIIRRSKEGVPITITLWPDFVASLIFPARRIYRVAVAAAVAHLTCSGATVGKILLAADEWRDDICSRSGC